MNLLCRLVGHKWTFPVPHQGRLWRGCDRCGRSQTMSPSGHWKWNP